MAIVDKMRVEYENRKRKVSIIERSTNSDNCQNKITVIELPENEAENGIEIEEKIVKTLCDVHGRYFLPSNENVRR